MKVVMQMTLSNDSLNFVRSWCRALNNLPLIEINAAAISPSLIEHNQNSPIVFILGNEITHYNLHDLVSIRSDRPSQVFCYKTLDEVESGEIPKTYSCFPGMPEDLPTNEHFHDAFVSRQIYLLPKNFLKPSDCDRPFDSISWNILPMPEYHGVFPRESARPMLFLDRDGIINVDKSYVYKIEDCEIIPDIYALLGWAHRHKFAISVLTNQSGIGRGMYTIDDASNIHHWMDQHFKSKGLPIGTFEMAPFHHQGPDGPLKKLSHLRKPFPGMALKIGESIPVELSKSYMVGDKGSDVLWLPLVKSYIVQGRYDLGPHVSGCKNLSDVLKKLQKDSGLL